jgi:hypothetical protein
MWWGCLVHGPVVHWWVFGWVLNTGLEEIVSIDSIDGKVSQGNVFITSKTSGMWWRWLVDGPVVVRRVFGWVLGIELNEIESIDSIDGKVS